MDKNGIIGLLLIGIIFIGWQFMIEPDKNELAENQRIQDSISQAQKTFDERNPKTGTKTGSDQNRADTSVVEDTNEVTTDASAQLEQLKLKFGSFAPAAVEKEEQDVVLENEHVKYIFSSKGGLLKYAEVKNFVTFDSLPLVLLNPENSAMNLRFDVAGKRINSDELYFDTRKEGNSVKFTALGENDERLSLVYALPKDARMMNFSVITRNMAADNMFLDIDFEAPKTEKATEEQRRYSNIFYRTTEEKVDYLSSFGDGDEEGINKALNWFSFKNQFFALTFIQNEQFPAGSKFRYSTPENNPQVTKHFHASVPLPDSEDRNMKIFTGPTKYNLLKTYDLDLEDQIDLGWAIFAWTNKVLVIPVFDFLSSLNLHIGIVILILTLFIKTLLFPITYKTYLSSAKQRAIKPEMEEISKKYGDDKSKQMEKQKEIMALYQKTGVNPFAGCIPMLIQLPILIAMFRFFPASIELRQKSFLWADDLSSYDTILSLPFDIPFYGDHVSGLTLLMAVSVFFTTKYNMSNTSMGGSNAQAKQIQMMMMYVMPVMLLFWFNNFSSGLSLYYFTANITTLGQQFVIRKFIINEDKIRAKIEDNKKKPKKKSKFQEKLQKLQEKQDTTENRKMRRFNK